MRLMVRHETTYSYREPVTSVIQHLRMTPRPHEGLFIRKWRVEIDADYRIDRSEDAFGNVLHTFTADGPVTDLNILVDADVETSDTAGVVRRTIERFPLIFWRRHTALTPDCGNIGQWADDIAAGEGGDRLATLHALNSAVLRQMRHAPGGSDTLTTAEAAFAAKAGVSQDFAHVMLTAARRLDIPARFISGYHLPVTPAGPQSRHSWIEAYVEGIGWIGFDPTTGLSATDRYIRVAVGLDRLDASPVRGAQTGGSDELLTVLVDVRQGPSIIED